MAHIGIIKDIRDFKSLKSLHKKNERKHKKGMDMAGKSFGYIIGTMGHLHENTCGCFILIKKLHETSRNYSGDC